MTNDISPTQFNMKDSNEKGKNGNAHRPTRKPNWTSCTGESICIKSRYLTANATLRVANGMFHIAVRRPYPLISTLHGAARVFNGVVSQRGKVILHAINTDIDDVLHPLLLRMEIGSEVTCMD